MCLIFVSFSLCSLDDVVDLLARPVETERRRIRRDERSSGGRSRSHTRRLWNGAHSEGNADRSVELCRDTDGDLAWERRHVEKAGDG